MLHFHHFVIFGEIWPAIRQFMKHVTIEYFTSLTIEYFTSLIILDICSAVCLNLQLSSLAS